MGDQIKVMSIVTGVKPRFRAQRKIDRDAVVDTSFVSGIEMI